ncbi:MAG: molybdopterin molybdotransferase MoeA [Alphaproteobacteria bacterium]|nr:molybdopterin molybdotransferase MoeA [Alphaproteobacteria bacterium]MDP6515535.1 molybdopterin molybdotransferase MoeA [Alphaproteobacteria bacterium]
MISVGEALDRILAAFEPLAPEEVSLGQALGRVLARDVAARRTQPPVAVSAMDGYAARGADVATVPAVLRLIGAAPAGAAYPGTVGPGETVRIFTGGPVPEGADTVVMQEDTEAEGDRVTVNEAAKAGQFVRAAGLDFQEGVVGLEAGAVLNARDIGLAAAMNHPWLSVRRQPRVAILATGDEIVMPGDPVGVNQIVSANSLALAAFVAACGGVPINLGIAPDRTDALRAMAAGARGTDLLVTTGGVSVGEHDLVREALGAQGLEVDFWRIAMRPGKPLMFGRLGPVPVMGVPGNPVSALVCCLIFLRPALGRMLGLAPDRGPPSTARLAAPLEANDRRQDYLRARLFRDDHGRLCTEAFAPQDSSMISLLAWADCLILRAPDAASAEVGAEVEIVMFPPGLPGV